MKKEQFGTQDIDYPPKRASKISKDIPQKNNHLICIHAREHTYGLFDDHDLSRSRQILLHQQHGQRLSMYLDSTIYETISEPRDTQDSIICSHHE